MTAGQAIEFLKNYPPETELHGYDGSGENRSVMMYENEELAELLGKPYITVSVEGWTA